MYILNTIFLTLIASALLSQEKNCRLLIIEEKRIIIPHTSYKGFAFHTATGYAILEPQTSNIYLYGHDYKLNDSLQFYKTKKTSSLFNVIKYFAFHVPKIY